MIQLLLAAAACDSCAGIPEKVSSFIQLHRIVFAMSDVRFSEAFEVRRFTAIPHTVYLIEHAGGHSELGQLEKARERLLELLEENTACLARARTSRR